jgi:hypothetical protein
MPNGQNPDGVPFNGGQPGIAAKIEIYKYSADAADLVMGDAAEFMRYSEDVGETSGTNTCRPSDPPDRRLHMDVDTPSPVYRLTAMQKPTCQVDNPDQYFGGLRIKPDNANEDLLSVFAFTNITCGGAAGDATYGGINDDVRLLPSGDDIEDVADVP